MMVIIKQNVNNPGCRGYMGTFWIISSHPWQSVWNMTLRLSVGSNRSSHGSNLRCQTVLMNYFYFVGPQRYSLRCLCNWRKNVYNEVIFINAEIWNFIADDYSSHFIRCGVVSFLGTFLNGEIFLMWYFVLKIYFP